VTLVAGIMEVIETPVYDTVGLPAWARNQDADPPPAELFTGPIGSMGKEWTGHSRVKSELETNLFEPRMLPTPQQFLLRSIRAVLVGPDGGLIPANSPYYRGAILRLYISQKTYWTGPLFKVADPAAMFLAPDALRGFSPEDRADIIRSLRHQFEHEETSPLIETQQEFYCRVDFDPLMKWDSIGAPGALTVLLEGRLARPVQ